MGRRCEWAIGKLKRGRKLRHDCYWCIGQPLPEPMNASKRALPGKEPCLSRPLRISDGLLVCAMRQLHVDPLAASVEVDCLGCDTGRTHRTVWSGMAPHPPAGATREVGRSRRRLELSEIPMLNFSNSLHLLT